MYVHTKTRHFTLLYVELTSFDTYNAAKFTAKEFEAPEQYGRVSGRQSSRKISPQLHVHFSDRRD